MSTDYRVDLAIGFVVDTPMLAAFARTIDEKAHLEQRFDPLTGKPTTNARIVDECAHTTFAIDGEEHDFADEVFEAISKKIGCEFRPYSDNDSGTLRAVFGPNIDDGGGECLGTHFDVGGEILFADVVAMVAEMDRIGDALRELGISVKRPIVGLRWTIS